MVTTFDELVKNPGIPVNILVEIETGRLPAAWTDYGSNNIYYTTHGIVFPQGVVSAVKDAGAALTAQTSLAALALAAGWYHDKAAQRLYVRLDDDGDPAESTVIVKFWIRIALHGVSLWVDASTQVHFDGLVKSIFSLKKAVSKNIFGAVDVSGGSLVCKNGKDLSYGNRGPWDDCFEEYLWSGSKTRFLFGGSALPYSEYRLFFTGRLQKPQKKTETLVFTVESMLGRLSKKISGGVYSTDDYEHLDPNAEGRPIPIVIGRCYNLKPTQVDTTNLTTRFGRKIKDTAALESFRLRSGGVQLWQDGDSRGTDPEDYVEWVHPDDGELKMNMMPARYVLTGDVEGETDESDNLIETYGAVARLLMQDADLGGLADDEIDIPAFTAMDTACPAPLGFALTSEMKINDILNIMDASVCGLHTVTEEGKITARTWDADIDTESAVPIDQSDIIDISFDLDESLLYQKVRIGYRQNHCVQSDTHYDGVIEPSEVQEDWSQECRYAEAESPDPKLLYGNEEVMPPVKTFLVDPADAEALAARYLALCKDIWLVVTIEAHLLPFELQLFQDIKVTHDRQPTGPVDYYKVISITLKPDMRTGIIEAFRLL